MSNFWPSGKREAHLEVCLPVFHAPSSSAGRRHLVTRMECMFVCVCTPGGRQSTIERQHHHSRSIRSIYTFTCAFARRVRKLCENNYHYKLARNSYNWLAGCIKSRPTSHSGSCDVLFQQDCLRK